LNFTRLTSESQLSVNGVSFFAPPDWKINACTRRAALNPYYEG
jgi:hypothetical protein